MNLSPNPFLTPTKPHGRTQLVNYAVFRQAVEARHGHNPGALGLDRWKGVTWAGLRWLYSNAKISREKAEEIRLLISVRYSEKSQVHKGFTRADHKAYDLATGVGRSQPAPKKGRSRKVDRNEQISNKIAELEKELAELRKGR